MILTFSENILFVFIGIVKSTSEIDYVKIPFSYSLIPITCEEIL